MCRKTDPRCEIFAFDQCLSTFCGLLRFIISLRFLYSLLTLLYVIFFVDKDFQKNIYKKILYCIVLYCCSP